MHVPTCPSARVEEWQRSVMRGRCWSLRDPKRMPPWSVTSFRFGRVLPLTIVTTDACWWWTIWIKVGVPDLSGRWTIRMEIRVAYTCAWWSIRIEVSIANLCRWRPVRMKGRVADLSRWASIWVKGSIADDRGRRAIWMENGFGISGCGRKRREKSGEANEKWFEFHNKDLKEWG